MNHPLIHSRECFHSYMGLWAIHSPILLAGVRSFMAGSLSRQAVDEEDTYDLTEDGIAIVRLHGTMMKARSKFGGVSTIETRREIRRAVADQAVRGIMVHVDSPGGSVAGTSDLADDLRAANIAKPVHVHADDTMASAAYWVASGARRITANRTGQVGSIGAMAVVEDTSKAYAAEGIAVHVVTSAGAETFKGAFVDGREVTPEQLAYLKSMVNEAGAAFSADIAKERGGRRNLSLEDATKLADGRMHSADDARKLGLIDAAESFDQALAAMRADLDVDAMRKRRRNTMAELRMKEMS